MSIKGQKKQPEYTEGLPCKRCGATKKIRIWRRRPNTGERYRTVRCHICYNKRSNVPNNANSLEWQRENREHLRAYQREYYKNKYKERNGTNAKRLRERTVYDDKKEIAEFYRNCPKGFHVDHIVPLNGKNVSGLHTVSNLQYLPATENLRKSNEWNTL